MKFTTLPFLSLIASASTALAAYPFQLNCTTPSAVFFRIDCYDNLHGRSLQLRKLSDGRQIVVIDAISPVLWAEVRNGIIYSQGRNDYNQRYDLGPVGHLINTTTTSTSSKQEFYFQNATKASKATKGFVLEFPTQDAVYSLYHRVPNDIVNGWIACKVADYWQLFYYTYFSEPSNTKGCTFLGIEVGVRSRLLHETDMSRRL